MTATKRIAFGGLFGFCVALALLLASVCCFDDVPGGARTYQILWPTTLFLDSVVDPVRPARSDLFLLLAVAANSIPYGFLSWLVGRLRYKPSRRPESRT
jgi:hypothetical protein